LGKRIQSEASGFSITSEEWTLCKVVNVLLEGKFRQVLGLCLLFLSQCLNQVLTAKSIGVSPCNWKYYNKNQYASLRLCSVRAFVSRPLFLILLIIHSCKDLSWIYFEQPKISRLAIGNTNRYIRCRWMVFFFWKQAVEWLYPLLTCNAFVHHMLH